MKTCRFLMFPGGPARIRSGLSLLGGGIVVTALLAGCGGGGGGGGTVLVTAEFTCAGSSPSQPDQVDMDCPSSASVMLEVQVLIDGPTTSSDIFGVKFDLVFDDTVLSYRSPVVEGTFLGEDGQPTILQADLQGGDPGRLIVAVTRQAQGGNPGGVQATSAGEWIVTIGFSSVQSGTTSIAFENFEIVDSLLNPLGGIQFRGPLTVTVD